MTTVLHSLRSGQVIVRIAGGLAVISGVALSSLHSDASQGSPDTRYRTRPSDCRYEPPAGKAVPVRTTDTGIKMQGYRAERMITQIADAEGLEGGELVVAPSTDE